MKYHASTLHFNEYFSGVLDKDADGFITSADVMALHGKLARPTQYKLLTKTIVTEVYMKNGSWCAKPADPKRIIEAGVIDTTGEQMVSRGEYSNDTIETYYLLLGDGSGAVAGWTTTYNRAKVLDAFVTDLEDKPIVVEPLATPAVPKQEKPKPAEKDPDDAAKLIQKAAKDKADAKIKADAGAEAGVEAKAAEPAAEPAAEAAAATDSAAPEPAAEGS